MKNHLWKKQKWVRKLDRRLTRHVKVCTKIDADFIKSDEVYSHPSPLLSARNAVKTSSPNYTTLFFLNIENNTELWKLSSFQLYISLIRCAHFWDIELNTRTHCYSFLALNRESDVSASDWLSQTRENYRNFSGLVHDTGFFRGGNPYKTL